MKNSVHWFPGGLFIPPLTHMKVDGQSDSFSPLRSPPSGTTPAHSRAVPPHLLCYKNAICSVQSLPPPPPLLGPSPPVASYLEIMTSIRFNIKQGKRGECSEWRWRRKSVDELLLSVSTCCPAVSACEGRGLAT